MVSTLWQGLDFNKSIIELRPSRMKFKMNTQENVKPIHDFE